MDLSGLDLDLGLAITRFGKDTRDDFFPDPKQYADILDNRTRTLERIAPQLRGFRPTKAACFDVPKSGLTLRYALHMRPVDRIVYQALIDVLAPEIDPLLSERVYSHRLRSRDAKWMFRNAVAQWKLFEDHTLAELRAKPGRFLVSTDITGYFENVQFRFVRRALENLLEGNSSERLKAIVEALTTCLKAWSPFESYGLPQCIDASSFVGNVLLDGIDKRMERSGWNYFRYMDDIKIVTDSEASARMALKELIGHLRAISLGLNSGKTRIVSAASPLVFEIITPPDETVDLVEEALKDGLKEKIVAVIDPLFAKTRQLIAADQTMDRRFRFCVNRIANLRRYKGIELPDAEDISLVLLDLLRSRPVSTDYICRYLSTAPMTPKMCTVLERLLVDEPLCVYEWQNYQLWTLAVQRDLQSDGLARRAHDVLKVSSAQPDVAGAAIYLGAMGTYSDREVLKARYSEDLPILVRRAFAIALQELHPADRGSFYRARSDEEPSVSLLADHLRELSAAAYVPPLPPVAVEELRDQFPDLLSW